MRISTELSGHDVKRSAKRPLILRDVPGKGRGVFAGRAYKVGEEVLEFVGEVRDVDDFTCLMHALQVGPRDFLAAAGEIDDYVNHSCDPNCGVRYDGNRLTLFAMRPIRSGEEIAFDYSTTQSGKIWSMNCACGARICRGFIGDFVDLPETLRQRYIKANAVLPFVLEEMGA